MVTALPWNVGFAIGHPEIDAQHRHLIQLINEIISAVEQRTVDRLPTMLDALVEAAAEHFRTEISALQEFLAQAHSRKQRPWPSRQVHALTDTGIDEHQAQHGLLLSELGGFRTLAPPALCARLKEWFVDHAIRQDARLRPISQAI